MPEENLNPEPSNSDPSTENPQDSTASVYDIPFDSSAMFNERGYDKSDATSLDGNEIINDFNGALSLKFPIYNFKGAGDLDLDLSLNYTSSMAHNIISASAGIKDDGSYLETANYAANILRFPKYNFNAPAWFLSLNGMALQVFNFEKSYFTKRLSDISNYKAINSQVKLLPIGYNITHEIDTVDSSVNRDRIYILNGDGSIETLINQENYSSNSPTWGRYISLNKHSYCKGIVEQMFETLPQIGIYKIRRLTLMKGDGLTYTYEEQRFNYADFTSSQYAVAYKIPKSFLLKKIQDKFGNKIEITYTSGIGRPIVNEINYYHHGQVPENDFKLKFDSVGNQYRIRNMINQGNEERQYTIDFDNLSTQRSYVDKITAFNGETINFRYDRVENPTEPDTIIRNAQRLHYGTTETGPGFTKFIDISLNTAFDPLFNPLKRVTAFTNTAGGTRQYVYMNYIDEPFNMSPDYTKIQSTSDSNYRGAGRDLFFQQMLRYKINKIDSTNIVRENFSYFYQDNYTNINNSRPYDPIDQNDDYSTTRIITSLDSSTLNQTPSEFTIERIYKVYKLQQYGRNISNHDLPGENKLMEERFKVVNESAPYLIKNYSYEMGSNSDGYSGSFLITNLKETYGSIFREYSYQYLYFSAGAEDTEPVKLMASNYFDNPVKRITFTDPLGRITETSFDYSSKLVYFFPAFNPWLDPHDTEQLMDSVYFLIYGLKINEKLIFNSQLYRSESWSYVKELNFDNDLNGYEAQLLNHKVYDISNSLNYLVTQYKYYKFDTQGRDLYTNGSAIKPTIEGNLKEISSPKGNVEKYFYHPISSTENTDTNNPNQLNQPRVSFNKMLSNYSNNIISLELFDRRFPSRTDHYVNPNFHLTIYRKFDRFGNLTMEASPLKFITTYQFDKLNRIKKKTPPYNFNSNDIFSDTQGYTIKNTYDDPNNIYSRYHKLDDGTDILSKSSYDGFFRETKFQLYSDSEISESEIKYNFLGNISKIIDPYLNYIDFSYSKYGDTNRTDFVDSSLTSNVVSYISSISNYFGITYSGFIQKQIFQDQEAKKIEKYFDAMGNLIREVKYFPPELTIENPSSKPIAVATDYKYDALNRITNVKTAEGKPITYEYDVYGRLKTISTSDNGVTYLKYDKDNNVIFSQKHYSPSSLDAVYNFYTYDGLNRLIGIGEASNTRPNFDTLVEADEFQFFNNNSDSFDLNDYLSINVYDTPESAPSGLLELPADYYSQENYVLGHLVATATRTRITDPWNIKYFRYDAYGRVIKMWSKISDLGVKVFNYKYNKANLITECTYQPASNNEYKKFYYLYDAAGRLSHVNVLESMPSEEDAIPTLDSIFCFVNYSYNKNFQVSNIVLNNLSYELIMTYNNRNWIEQLQDLNGNFNYQLSYYRNGNVQIQEFSGNYKDNFDKTYVSNQYFYDSANRLFSTQNLTGADILELDISNSYDYDGNIKRMIRNFNGDDFTYNYYANTNKLQNITSSGNQFTYDADGNLISNSVNKNFEMKYDYRNLLLEVRSTRSVANPDDTTEFTRYWYDEKGNRIRKLVLRTVIQNPQEPNWNDFVTQNTNSNSDSEPVMSGSGEDAGSIPVWSVYRDIFYVRDLLGKETAEYSGGSLDKWNVFGLGNVGRIEHTGEKRFYLKDHSESIRVEINHDNQIAAAEDYDSWGYTIRQWDANTRYKFSSKERDFETGYDYFGGRYYNSRIGRWNSMERKMSNTFHFSPYNYCFSNPTTFRDPSGNDPIRDYFGYFANVVDVLMQNPGASLHTIGEIFRNSDVRYVYTEVWGILDLNHVFNAAFVRANLSSLMGTDGTRDEMTNKVGEGFELLQKYEPFGILNKDSFLNKEDLPSNFMGLILGRMLGSGNLTKSNLKIIKEFFTSLRIISPNSPRISDDKWYIPSKVDINNGFKLPQGEWNNVAPYWGEKPDFNEAKPGKKKAQASPAEPSGPIT